MSTQFRIQINDLWLTRDGTETGFPCYTEIENRAALLRETIGNGSVGNDGQPFRELPEVETPGGGRVFAFNFRQLPKAKYDALKALLDQAATDPDFDLTINGTSEALGNFAVVATVWDDPVYLDEGEFVGSPNPVIKKIRASLITKSVG
jgi:hypothetical protein